MSSANHDDETIRRALHRYDATPFDKRDCGEYVDWALRFFVDQEQAPDPYVEITVELDVTEARAVYDKRFANDAGASFTAYLFWRLLGTLSCHEPFLLRHVEGTWYSLRNPPLFFPVAVGGKRRFGEVLIEDAMQYDWAEFAGAYRAGIDNARTGSAALVSPVDFALSQFIGNLPNLQFSALKLHNVVPRFAKSYFYFGKRTTNPQGAWRVPFAAKIHHGNADPYVLDLLIQDFSRRLRSPDRSGAMAR